MATHDKKGKAAESCPLPHAAGMQLHCPSRVLLAMPVLQTLMRSLASKRARQLLHGRPAQSFAPLIPLHADLCSAQGPGIICFLGARTGRIQIS